MTVPAGALFFRCKADKFFVCLFNVKSVDFIKDGLQGEIKIALKYTGPNKTVPAIAGLKRISKPGLRVYAKCEELPKVLGGLGIAIVSTSKGLMTDREARKQEIGGEVLAYIW